DVLVVRNLRHLLPAFDVSVAPFNKAANGAILSRLSEYNRREIAMEGLLTGGQPHRHDFRERRASITSIAESETTAEEQDAPTAFICEVANQLLLLKREIIRFAA